MKIPPILILLGLSLNLLNAQESNTTSLPEKLSYKPEQLVALALKNNLGLKINELETGIKKDAIDQEAGRFSPEATFQIGIDRVYRRQNANETRNSFFGQSSEKFEGDTRYLTVGLGGRIPFGTSYEFTASSTRESNTFTRQPNTPFDPEYATEFRLRVIQPLWRNFGLKVGLAPLNVSKAEAEVAREETRGAIESVMAQVLLACYELYFSNENIKVKEESVSLAEQLLSDNQKRVEQGRMSQIAVTQAEARIAEAQAELVVAEVFYEQRQAQLKELTQNNYELESADFELVDMKTLLPEPELIDNLGAFATTIFRNNPDYLAAIKQAEAEGHRVVYSKSQTYPEVNLILSLGSSGLENDFGSSYQNIEEREDPDWGVGVTVNLPIWNKTPKAEWRASKKRQSQALIRVKQTEIQLLRALEVAKKELQSGIDRKKFMGESVRLAEEALKAEQSRLVNGVTTNIEVLNQQRELSLSQSKALSAEVEIRKAWLELLLLQGTIGEKLGFKYEFKNTN